MYNARGFLSTMTVPDPRDDNAEVTTTFVRDARDRVTEVRAPDDATVKITYSPWAKRFEDADGAVTDYRYDGFGLLRQVIQYDKQGSAVTRYEFDGADRLSRITDADRHVTQILHDGEDNRTAIIRPASGMTRRWTYRYSPDGELSSKEDPDGRTTEYFYDDLGRLSDEKVVNPGVLPDTITAKQLGTGWIHYNYDAQPQRTDRPNLVGRLRDVTFFDSPDQNPRASTRRAPMTTTRLAVFLLNVDPSHSRPTSTGHLS